ncbi:hypothetical protein [Bradyrhizobium sp. ARR65]|uniref:hypothetical protein n=1 Tax=Bradyrhizobium sp. ARR65 TaxID=1040989 RepID=UPI0004654C4E|nr:hypothetical protein [Bradyrhizobium sp. ARR65]
MSSFALDYTRPTESVTIATGGCQVASLIDGSFKTFPDTVENHDWQRIGRIKCGTGSNGFRNIAIANCVLRGLALETIHGSLIEDITVTGTMRDIRNAPLFLRLGARLRGPTGVPVGPAVSLNDVSDFRTLANRGLADVSIKAPISHMRL